MKSTIYMTYVVCMFIASFDTNTNKHVNNRPRSSPPKHPLPSRLRGPHRSESREVMLITRGTRGDVQPFVALARGDRARGRSSTGRVRDEWENRGEQAWWKWERIGRYWEVTQQSPSLYRLNKIHCSACMS